MSRPTPDAVAPLALVVDDDARIARFIVRVARSAGWRTFAVDGPAAFEAALAHATPAVVFMDLMMGEVDGLALMRRLAERGCGAALVITSGVDARVREAAHALGSRQGLSMLPALAKPLTAAAVRDRLRTTCPDPAPVPAAPVITPGALREALAQGRIVNHYQPIVSLRAGRARRVEALARWHRGGRWVPPSAFVPVADREGMAGALTLSVLESGLRDLERVAPAMDLAVNLSPPALAEPDLPERIESVLAAHGWEPSRLMLELTETEAFTDDALAAEALTRLRLKGMRLSLDDFGTGFATVGQAYRLPFEEMKLDRAFVGPCPGDARAESIVRSTVALAREVGLEMVAEGAERPETVHWLRDLGCDLVQGFAVCKPLPAQDLGRWLRRGHAAGGSPRSAAAAPATGPA